MQGNVGLSVFANRFPYYALIVSAVIFQWLPPLLMAAARILYLKSH
jgi:hypothetical protein